jgi:hypothetical protein
MRLDDGGLFSRSRQEGGHLPTEKQKDITKWDYIGRTPMIPALGFERQGWLSVGTGERSGRRVTKECSSMKSTFGAE